MGEIIGHIELHRSRNMPALGFYNHEKSSLTIGEKDVPMEELAIEIGCQGRETLMVKIPLAYLTLEVHDGEVNDD